MMANFNNNLRLGNGDTFSHENGFQQSSDPTLETNGGSGGSFEDRINQYSYMLFVGSMILFLAYQHLGG